MDVGAIKFLKSEGIPVTFVMTKADQLKTQSERASRKKEVEKAVLELGFSSSFIFWVSAKTKDGLHLADRRVVPNYKVTSNDRASSQHHVSQLHFAMLIEVIFMLATFIVLSKADAKSFMHWAGMVLLCLTFCWSVILGCVLCVEHTPSSTL